MFRTFRMCRTFRTCRTMFRTIRDMLAVGRGICSQDQHAQAQHWLRHAQAQPYLISPRRRLSLSMHELSLRMPEPMLSLSMLFLATYPWANRQHVPECSEHRSARSERSARPERSEHFWTPGNTVRGQHRFLLKKGGEVAGPPGQKRSSESPMPTRTMGLRLGLKRLA